MNLETIQAAVFGLPAIFGGVLKFSDASFSLILYS